MEFNEPSEKIYNLDDKLVRFACKLIFIVRKLNKLYKLEYYKN